MLAGVPTRVLPHQGYTDRTAYDRALVETIAPFGCRIACLAGFMRLLGPTFLRAFPGGVLNVHPALLPSFPGLHAHRQALEHGVKVTGCTVHLVDEGTDTGPIVAATPLELDPRETTGSLTERLADLGAAMIVDTLARLARQGSLAVTAQPSEGASYATKILRGDALLDWSQDAAALDRRIRAMSPSPGALAGWRGKPVKIHAAVPIVRVAEAEPGTIIAAAAQGIDVACGRGTVLRVMQLQPAAGKSMPAPAFLAGYRPRPGERLEPGRPS